MSASNCSKPTLGSKTQSSAVDACKLFAKRLMVRLLQAR